MHERKVIQMSRITEHFDSTEFQCPHCGKNEIQRDFVERLEKLHKALNAKSIIVSSGYRCPTHSVAVGGYVNDAHVKGFAADIIAYKKKDGSPYDAFTVAKEAEKLGFGGIAPIDNHYVHVDSRDCNEYANHKWFGNEKTGETYNTFQNIQSEPIDTTGLTTEKNVIEIMFNGKSVFRKEW